MTGISTNTIDLFKNDLFLLGDFMDFICGNVLGEGCSRIVYEFNPNPNYVIKIDKSNDFHNVSEWDVWTNIDAEIKKFLAPCVQISSCGRVMLQQKTTPIKIKQFPVEIPEFITDIKLDNWGMLKGRPVCHDYANHNLYARKQELIIHNMPL